MRCLYREWEKEKWNESGVENEQPSLTCTISTDITLEASGTFLDHNRLLASVRWSTQVLVTGTIVVAVASIQFRSTVLTIAGHVAQARSLHLNERPAAQNGQNSNEQHGSDGSFHDWTEWTTSFFFDWTWFALIWEEEQLDKLYK